MPLVAVGGQAFHFDATVYPRQAEITLNHYSTERVKGTEGSNSDATKLGTSLGRESSRFGCGGPHPWMRNKVIICPHKDQTGICEAAVKNYKE
jgi:hypothetical protein